MNELWTLSELTEEVTRRIEALPPPKNGQVRAVPDDRTIRYYGTLGLLDRPELRGRMAFYGRRHLAQVVAIKRLQSTGRSLAEIEALWPTLDDVALARMSGVELAALRTAKASRSEFWKKEPISMAMPMPNPLPMPGPLPVVPVPATRPPAPPAPPAPPTSRYDAGPPVVGMVVPASGGGGGAVAPSSCELRIELAPNVYLSLVVEDGVAISAADIRAFRAAAAPLIELAQRSVEAHPGGDR